MSKWWTPTEQEALLDILDTYDMKTGISTFEWVLNSEFVEKGEKEC